MRFRKFLANLLWFIYRLRAKVFFDDFGYMIIAFVSIISAVISGLGVGYALNKNNNDLAVFFYAILLLCFAGIFYAVQHLPFIDQIPYPNYPQNGNDE